MASKENGRKRKLEMEFSSGNVDNSCLSLEPKILEFVFQEKIKDIANIVKLIPKNSKYFFAAFMKATELGHKRILQLMVEQGLNVNRKNHNGETALLVAARHGHVDLVKLLVRNGADVNLQNEEGQTSLMSCVKIACCTPLLEYLLYGDSPCDVNTQDKNGRTALMISIQRQDFCSMKLLMSHKDILLEVKDECGETALDFAIKSDIKEIYCAFEACYKMNVASSPLVFAITSQKLDLVQAVIHTQSLQEINALDESFLSPLMISLNCTPLNLAIVGLLVAAGANVNVNTTNEHLTPLFLACKAGSLEAVKLLVKAGADLNSQCTDEKLTPLMCACINNNCEIVKFLISKKADVNLNTTKNKTAVIFAVKHCKKKACVQCLMKHGAVINDAIFSLAVSVGCYKLIPSVSTHVSQDELSKQLVKACKENNYALAKFLLTKGANVNYKDNGHEIPVIISLYNVKMLNLLLRHGADVNLTDISGNNALIEAVHFNSSQVIETLVKHGANINSANGKGYTPLMMAAKCGQLTAMNSLLQFGADINFVSSSVSGYKSALNAALGANKTDAVKFLLKRGANVNQKENFPLMQSLYGNLENVDLCLKHGADLHILTSTGCTILTFALQKCCELSKIKLLLNAGADPNSKNIDGETALLVASKYCSTLIIESLLICGADISAEDRHGSSVLLVAVKHSITNGSKIDLLINYGADVNKANHQGVTPLIAAVNHCHMNILQLLVLKGANVSAQDSNGLTSLMHAVKAGRSTEVKYLIDCQADVELRNTAGDTAIMLAAREGNAKILRELLDAGADPSAVNYQGQDSLGCLLVTLYDLQQYDLHSEAWLCFEIMLEAGLKPDLTYHKNSLLFHKLIVSYEKPLLIDLLLRTGSMPPLISFPALKSICIVPLYYSVLDHGVVSPLLTAMFSKNIHLVICFLKYWYLDRSDMAILSKYSLHNEIFRENMPSCLHYIVHQPFSLSCLSFLVLSEILGGGPARESQVYSLPVPSVIKKALLFQLLNQCPPDEKVKKFTQRTEFQNYTQHGALGLDEQD